MVDDWDAFETAFADMLMHRLEQRTIVNTDAPGPKSRTFHLSFIVLDNEDGWFARFSASGVARPKDADFIRETGWVWEGRMWEVRFPWPLTAEDAETVARTCTFWYRDAAKVPSPKDVEYSAFRYAEQPEYSRYSTASVFARRLDPGAENISLAELGFTRVWQRPTGPDMVTPLPPDVVASIALAIDALPACDVIDVLAEERGWHAKTQRGRSWNLGVGAYIWASVTALDEPIGSHVVVTLTPTRRNPRPGELERTLLDTSLELTAWLGHGETSMVPYGRTTFWTLPHSTLLFGTVEPDRVIMHIVRPEHPQHPQHRRD